jgi:TrmH family RNA methyltransferase
VQRLRRLAARRSARWEAGRFVVEGPKLLDEALRAGASVEEVYLDETAGDAYRELADRAGRAGAGVHEVAAGVLDRACDAATPQPVAAIVAMRHVPLGQLPLDGLTLVAVGVQDPGNAGTLLRSAAASGSGAVVVCSGAVDVYSPKTVRASAGAIFHIPVTADVEPAGALGHLGSAGVVRLAAVARGGRDYTAVDWTGSAALVLGSESHGLPTSIGRLVDGEVSIPMRPEVESLNVAMAATVMCFEAARQRRAPARGAA